MAINKVEFGDETLMDITDSTVDEDNLEKGIVAYGADGKRITGKATYVPQLDTLPNKPDYKVVQYIGETTDILKYAHFYEYDISRGGEVYYYFGDIYITTSTGNLYYSSDLTLKAYRKITMPSEEGFEVGFSEIKNVTLNPHYASFPPTPAYLWRVEVVPTSGSSYYADREGSGINYDPDYDYLTGYPWVEIDVQEYAKPLDILNLFNSINEKKTPEIIKSNNDLNDFLIPGVYHCNDSTVAATLSNTPHTTGNFKLLVVKNVGNGVERFWGAQIIITNSISSPLYVRGISTDTTNNNIVFTAWERIALDSNITTLSNQVSSKYLKFGNEGLSFPSLASASDVQIAHTSIYVTTTGNDSTGDGTSAKPFKTIGKAFELINRSHAVKLMDYSYRIYVAAGTYTETKPLSVVGKSVYVYLQGNVTIKCLASQPAFSAYRGARLTITSSDSATNRTLTLQQAYTYVLYSAYGSSITTTYVIFNATTGTGLYCLYATYNSYIEMTTAALTHVWKCANTSTSSTSCGFAYASAHSAMYLRMTTITFTYDTSKTIRYCFYANICSFIYLYGTITIPNSFTVGVVAQAGSTIARRGTITNNAASTKVSINYGGSAIATGVNNF